jgi:hypothetical protein
MGEGALRTAVDVVVVPGAVVGDLARRARVPALAADPVVHVVPGDAVRAAGAVVIVDGAAAVGPEGVEVAVVGAGAGLDAALLHGLERAGRDGGGEGRDEESERDHDGGSRERVMRRGCCLMNPVLQGVLDVQPPFIGLSALHLRGSRHWEPWDV